MSEMSYEDDFAWAKASIPAFAESENPLVGVLEHELLQAINTMDDLEDEEEMEKQLRSVISRLQLEAYMAGYARGVNVSGDDTTVRITARIDDTEATELVKALISTGEIPLTIRVINE